MICRLNEIDVLAVCGGVCYYWSATSTKPYKFADRNNNAVCVWKNCGYSTMKAQLFCDGSSSGVVIGDNDLEFCWDGVGQINSTDFVEGRYCVVPT